MSIPCRRKILSGGCRVFDVVANAIDSAGSRPKWLSGRGHVEPGRADRSASSKAAEQESAKPLGRCSTSLTKRSVAAVGDNAVLASWEYGREGRPDLLVPHSSGQRERRWAPYRHFQALPDCGGHQGDASRTRPEPAAFFATPLSLTAQLQTNCVARGSSKFRRSLPCKKGAPHKCLDGSARPFDDQPHPPPTH